MSDLESQVENTEEVDSAVEIAEEPTKGAEKGDKSAHKQGSSSEEKIESGKGEVVKPDENPVDKAVAAAKKAADGTKAVSDDVNKGAEKGDSKAEKIKEDEDSNEDEVVQEAGQSKMELIKAAVDSMKGLTKEDLNKLFSSLSEDEVDESLTKAEVARNIVEALKGLSIEEVTKFVESLKEEDGEDEDEDEDESEDEAEESVKEENESAEVESSLVEIEIDDDLSKISESLDLSEENAEKAKTIFKAAVHSKVEEVKKELEEQYSNELKTQVETVKEELSSSVDKYLTYCAEEWTKENELAIERGLRSEMTENFIEGLKKLFVEHYVEVPEDKYNVVDELANRLDEMESKLDAEVSKNMEITEEIGSLKRQNVVREACEDLSESQKEKMESLSNGVDYKDEADFAEKVAELKEAYFSVDGETIAEETKEEEGTGDFSSNEEKVLDPNISRYSEALTKLKPLG
tara:strand:+ start:6445 stop:7830 length:1386 start_codon:yes stop_codon:yes gene_type:complete